MKDLHENRRVRMTRLLIKNALLELLEKQDMANITVTAVCDAADVHRSTFYKYYTDTASLMREIEQDFLDQIPKPLPGFSRKQLLKDTAAFFDYVKQNEKASRVLFSESTSNSFTARLVDVLCSEYIPVWEVEDNLTARFIRLYIANGTVGMLKGWVNENFPVGSQRIAEMMYSFSVKLAEADHSDLMLHSLL